MIRKVPTQHKVSKHIVSIHHLFQFSQLIETDVMVEEESLSEKKKLNERDVVIDSFERPVHYSKTDHSLLNSARDSWLGMLPCM